jgi:hypothetical protein
MIGYHEAFKGYHPAVFRFQDPKTKDFIWKEMSVPVNGREDAIRAQDLRVLCHHYLSFAAPSYFKIGPYDPKDNKNGYKVKEFQKNPAAEKKRVHDLGMMEKEPVEYLRDVPEERSWDKLRRHLWLTAPPPVYDKVKNSSIVVFTGVSTKEEPLPTHILACFRTPHKVKGAGDQYLDVHLCVNMQGGVFLEDVKILEPFLRKKKTDAPGCRD